MTLANAPHVGRDAAISASDLPDGESQIFLQRGMDRPIQKLPDEQITLIRLKKIRLCAKLLASRQPTPDSTMECRRLGILDRPLSRAMTAEYVGVAQDHHCEDEAIHLSQKALCADRWMPGSSPGMTSVFVHAHPESRDSLTCNCTSEVWSFGPSRNDERSSCRGQRRAGALPPFAPCRRLHDPRRDLAAQPLQAEQRVGAGFRDLDALGGKMPAEEFEMRCALVELLRRQHR
jgi:hypothetical protein